MNSLKAVTLLELLRIYAQNYVRVVHCIAQISTALVVKEGKSSSRDFVISALGLFDGIRPQFSSAGLTNTVAQIERTEQRWNEYGDYGIFAIQCGELLHRLEDELKARVFLAIPTKVQYLYENPRSGWEDCIARFSIVDNVDEMNRCFVFGRYTASVFHSLLIAEAGVIELGKYIGVTDGKTGWDATSKELQKIVKAGRNGYSFTIPFNSLEQINQSVETMKTAWRNRVNHEAGRLVVMIPDFSEPIAEEIILATRSFMRRLASDIPKADR